MERPDGQGGDERQDGGGVGAGGSDQIGRWRRGRDGGHE